MSDNKQLPAGLPAIPETKEEGATPEMNKTLAILAGQPHPVQITSLFEKGRLLERQRDQARREKDEWKAKYERHLDLTGPL